MSKALTAISPPGSAPSKGMRWVPGGTFLMGSDLPQYPEEGPPHTVNVDGFWIDQYQVTVDDYRRFVRATGYKTVAERPLDSEYYPNADPSLLVPGSMVFQKAAGPDPLDDIRNWWVWVPGACWKHPEGPRSTVAKRERH